MPDAKRPDPKRRSPASRPGKAGKSGEATRGRPRSASPVRREPRVASRASEPRPVEPEVAETAATEEPADGKGKALEPIRQSIVEAAEQQSEQRLGSAARRAAILAAVICVLTLTIAGPVRTYFSQRAEMRQLADVEAQLRTQIADLEEQKVKLGDPVFIAAQARERLGFVMPGEIPYQVQLPTPVGAEVIPGQESAAIPSGQPWYTSLWHTIADAPHGPAPAPLSLPPGPAPAPPAPPDGPPPGG